jgi:NAD kinase/nicotinic acid mononucleotide adenylyltransferase
VEKKIAIYRGNFNPPGRRHRLVAETLCREFDEVIVAPWHRLPGETIKYDVPTVYRATMIDLAFQGLSKVRIEFFDLEAGDYTPASNILEKIDLHGDIWFILRPDMIRGGAMGESRVHRSRDERFWKNQQFVIVRNTGEKMDPSDLPPHHRFLDIEEGMDSGEIRGRIFHKQPISGSVDPQVEAYIRRRSLYTGMPQMRTTRFMIDEVRPLIVADEWNKKSQEMRRKLPAENTENPNIILVVGGDGTMLRTIRRLWRKRLPFYGINTGHLGFLLNSGRPPDIVGQSLIVEQMPLLHVETLDLDGEQKISLAFNEAWVERVTGQTAWIEVTVDGRVRFKKMVADGALVSTAAGSASYARAMGAAPLPLSTQALLLVGSNVLYPVFWQPAVLPLNSEVEFRTLDHVKRPLNGFVDGVPQGKVSWMGVKTSNIAAVELAFAPGHDPAEKLARIQFPTAGEAE